MKNEKQYKEVRGLFFDVSTPEKVCNIIADHYHTLPSCRLKIYYGDTKTGRDWCEENDTIGTVGRSTGKIKIPLLIKTARSMGGGAILDHCIVKIRQANGGTLYQHPNYVRPKVEIVKGDLPEYPFNTIVNGKLHGRHKTERSAKICKAKIE